MNPPGFPLDGKVSVGGWMRGRLWRWAAWDTVRSRLKWQTPSKGLQSLATKLLLPLLCTSSAGCWCSFRKETHQQWEAWRDDVSYAQSSLGHCFNKCLSIWATKGNALILCLTLADCLSSIRISCKPSAFSPKRAILSASSVALRSECKLNHHSFFHRWRNLGDLPRGRKKANGSGW